MAVLLDEVQCWDATGARAVDHAVVAEWQDIYRRRLMEAATALSGNRV